MNHPQRIEPSIVDDLCSSTGSEKTKNEVEVARTSVGRISQVILYMKVP